MRVAERVEQEEHFSEGEPDLEPPEELAVGELDDDMLLEEDLDSEIVLEEDVDEDTLEASLDDLVHLGDDEDEDDDTGQTRPVGTGTGPVTEEAEDTEELDVETLDLVDVEESLDRILRERLAADEDGRADLDDDESTDGRAGAENGAGPRPTAAWAGVELVTVAPCRADEFVCRGCFLVRSRVLLADATGMRCRDCTA